MEHSPLIRLDAARRAWKAAQHACPHWDEESSPVGTGHDCCCDLEKTENEYHLAHAAYRKRDKGVSP